MSIKHLVILLLLIPTVFAADWVEVDLRHDWNYISKGFCKDAGQCLVTNSGSEQYDDLPRRYWEHYSLTGNANQPKCIQTGQYIEDHYCENEKWASRTKLVSKQLLALALDKTPNNFSIYCDNYANVLNEHEYDASYGPVTRFIRYHCLQENKKLTNCVNNICVMKYGDKVAFGMAVNTDISGSDSPLQALNLDPTSCNNAKVSDGNYRLCNFGVWYNHKTESVLYLPDVSVLPAPTQKTTDFFITPYNLLKNYVFTVVHKPDQDKYNYAFFNIVPHFNQLYMAKEDFDFVYGFRQTNQTMQRVNYAGWYFSNIDLPKDVCNDVIKRYDDWANCESQPSATEFFVAAHKKLNENRKDVSIVDAWVDMTGKFRVAR